MKQYAILSLLCTLTLGLNACSGAKEKLGLDRTIPDEFSVVKRAPLAMPPGYGLRPPTPGAARPQEQETSTQARENVFGSEGAPSTNSTSSGTAESALLQRAGGQYTDPDIRRKIDTESGEVDNSKKPVAERLLGIMGGGETSSSVVNAQKEAERIRQNIENGNDITEGETPSIED